MDSRREFLKKAALLSGGAGLFSGLPPALQKAFAINPDPGTTYLDAEHIVFLMQENRSFDHSYGMLQGVRGFNDPRAISLPDKNPVWVQTNAAGETYTPFRTAIKESKVTWLGSLPHSWSSMTDARNQGFHDKWLDAKQSGRDDCKHIPLTLGYYNRTDIPFYYALADAFTVCDQHFCSSLTGTTPNRLYFLTGTIREKHDENIIANVYNSDIGYNKNASWKTFPEYLEENGVSWKIYQNELSIDSGLGEEKDDWLSNFTNNPIEWFRQYQVGFAASRMQYLQEQLIMAQQQVEATRKKLESLRGGDAAGSALKEELEQWEKRRQEFAALSEKYNAVEYSKLDPRTKSLHEKAFTTNRDDPHFRSVEQMEYDDNGIHRSMTIPGGDILHQFRKDVDNGNLPTVSWLVAPANFSDHPHAPWYGAWYLSEVFNILTRRPEVWKKTIFILNYDENDGYFDHVPPFVAPDPYRPGSGKVSEGIHTGTDYVSREQNWMKNKNSSNGDREGPIGLGFRVPLVVASPWSRGGWVCSEVFDLTSPIKFLEHFLSHKTGKTIRSQEITPWRRAVSGDLTSVFRPYQGEQIGLPEPLEKASFLQGLHRAQFKELPQGFKKLSAEEIARIKADPLSSPYLPQQEKGVRRACPIPYQVYADGVREPGNNKFRIRFLSGKDIFGERTAGCPFIVYTPDLPVPPRHYTLSAGAELDDEWTVAENGQYLLRVYGPNGFFREFSGSSAHPLLDAHCGYEQTKGEHLFTGNIVLQLQNRSSSRLKMVLHDNAYKTDARRITMAAGASEQVVVDLKKSAGWYDISVKLPAHPGFEWRYAGHVETGQAGITDPYMGRVI